jgi:hypothetical protein
MRWAARCAPTVIAEGNMVRLTAGVVSRISVYVLAIRDVTSVS